MSLQPPFTTSDGYIVDHSGQRLLLQSVNWYGASDADNVVMGLDHNHISAIASLIRSIGFNSVRLPFSNQMIQELEPIASEKLTRNPQLKGKSPLTILDVVVETLATEGLLTILNNHTTTSMWCCNYDDNALWFGSKQTAKQWVEDWEILVKRYKHIPQMIGVDLRNEVRSGPFGTANWGKDDDFDWHQAAEIAGNHLLSINPNLLIIVEGINYASDLRQAGIQPIRLTYPKQLVYSPHVYSWFGGLDGKSLGQLSYSELCHSLDDAWGYLGPRVFQNNDKNTPLTNKPVPLWISEMGAGPNDQPKFLTSMCRYIQERELNWAWWPLNVGKKPNSEEIETWGLVNSDWNKSLDDWRLKLIQQLMNTQNDQFKEVNH